MKFLIPRAATPASVLAVLAMSTLAAQEPRRLNQPDSIPLDLATALMSAGGIGNDPQIMIGAVPGWMTPRIAVPANARILGSAFIGTTGLAIISTPDMPDAALMSVRRELQAKGWKSAPPQPSYGGGFRSASMAAAMDPSRSYLCSDQQMLYTSARRRGVNTDVSLRISAMPPVGNGPCNPRDLPPGYPRSPWPTLYNPMGVPDGAQLCGADGPFGSQGTSAVVRTPMSAASLIDHYAKQLSDSGWRAPSDSTSVIGRTWTRTDSTGAPVELTITVATSPRDASCRTLNMSVHTLKKP